MGIQKSLKNYLTKRTGCDKIIKFAFDESENKNGIKKLKNFEKSS